MSRRLKRRMGQWLWSEWIVVKGDSVENGVIKEINTQDGVLSDNQIT